MSEPKGKQANWLPISLCNPVHATVARWWSYAPSCRVPWIYGPAPAAWHHTVAPTVTARTPKHQHQHRAFVTVNPQDEFLIVTDPKYNNSIPAVLREYETHGAVMVHWWVAGLRRLVRWLAGRFTLPASYGSATRLRVVRQLPSAHTHGPVSESSSL